MKRLIVLTLVCFVGLTAYSQQKQNPKYQVKGDLVQATLFHDNGLVAQTGFYTKDGKLQGEWNSFDVDGNKTATAYYNEGNKVGTWTFYNGNEMKKVDYSDSRIAQIKTWKVTDTRVVSY